MYIPRELADEIRIKNDIVEVVGSYVPLKRSGSGYVGLCPFHNEKTPSFHVSGQRQIYHCFGCGAGGNVVSFVMDYENMSYPEAMEHLASRVGVVIPENTSQKGKEEASRKGAILDALREAAAFYYKVLRSPAGTRGMEYFVQRGLKPEIMKRFGLGYAGMGKSNLFNYLKERGFETDILREAGLIIIDEKYGIRDRFFNRVMFPIQDMNKKVIGFGGRVMGEGMPKYLNSQENSVFNKGRNLYGLNYARSSRQNSMILCEGYMDVIAMHQAGFDQAVASLGTALTPGQAALIGRITKNAYISYDSDEAGTKASLRAIDILKDAGIGVKIINLSPYKDPDELIKAMGTDGMKERIDKAESAFSFRLRNLEQGLDVADPDERTVFLKRAAGYLVSIDDELERENHMLSIADKYKVPLDVIRRQVRDIALSNHLEDERQRVLSIDRKAAVSRNPSPGKETNGSILAQKLLLAYLCENNGVYEIVKDYISPNDFCDEICQRTARLLFSSLALGNADPAGIVAEFQDPGESAVVAGIFYEELKGTTSDAKEVSRIIKDLLVKVKSSGYMRDVSEMGKDPEALNRIIKGKQDIEQLKKMEIRISDGTE